MKLLVNIKLRGAVGLRSTNHYRRSIYVTDNSNVLYWDRCLLCKYLSYPKSIFWKILEKSAYHKCTRFNLIQLLLPTYAHYKDKWLAIWCSANFEVNHSLTIYIGYILYIPSSQDWFKTIFTTIVFMYKFIWENYDN